MSTGTAEPEKHLVFLSHNSADKPQVLKLFRSLRRHRISVWLDATELIPGDEFQEKIEEALRSSDVCIVCVGPSGKGPWQNAEMRAAISRRVQEPGSGFRVIPILLPGAKRGERSALPEFLQSTIWVEFPAIDDPDSLAQLVRGIRGKRGRLAPQTANSVCPYRGLQAFDVRSAGVFYGREAMTEWLIDKLKSTLDAKNRTRVLAILGPSGSGKSSLAQAGLTAMLQKGAISGSQKWLYCIFRPGPDPIETLAIQLARLLGENSPSWDRLLSSLRSDQQSLHLYARMAMSEMQHDRRLVLVVDQFEECFTQCQNDKTRAAFFDNLTYAAGAEGGQIIVLLTLRTDFYGRCASHGPLAAALSEHQELVGNMTEAEIRRAIELPAQAAGCEFENGLVDLLLKDVGNEPGALPLLQHALLELWNHRSGRRLTIDAYHTIGGVTGALEQRAERVYENLSDAEKEVCRRIFLRLVGGDTRTGDIKRNAHLSELISLKAVRSTVEEVIDKLTDPEVRLVRTWSSQSEENDLQVELSHEALIRSWSRLGDWMRDARSSLEAQRRVAEATTEWLSQKRHESFLFSGLRLAESLDWAEAHPDDLSTMEREFLEESRKRYAQERRLSDAATLDQLEASAPKIWDVVDEKRKWLARATTLTTRIPEHQKHLERIRKSASVQAKAPNLPQWEFESDDVRDSHDTLMLLIERLTRFGRGLMNAAEHSLRVSSSLWSLTIEGCADQWKDAIESIADPSICPKYSGLRLTPQLGLIPLWRNNDSGLWEFAHLLTGECARRENDVVEVADDTGIVLILIPGGSFKMGSRPPTLEAQAGTPNVDPYCRVEEETPVHLVQLDPFFISKYQLTQGQFMRAMGGNVSYHRPDDPSRGIILAHPVECISWKECDQAFERTGLILPTEAQWEYAARGGTSSIWWCGNDSSSLSGKVNLFGCRESSYPYSHPSPVGWFRFPNPFGLEDVIGNVWEWCKDWFGSYSDPVSEGTGERLPGIKTAKVCRGGSFFNTADFGRSSVRYFRVPVDGRFNNLGVRAARKIEMER